MRIVLAGFLHETNTFAPRKADFRAFELGGGSPGLSRGEGIFAAVAGRNIASSGFIEAARAAGHQIVPTVWAAASPSAQVTRDAYERLAGEIVDGIRAALPIDAVYLDLHGAMVAEHLDDGEGELITRVRAVVGEIPIIVSLDLHANMTRAMLTTADALVCYRTYPHIDMRDTGIRAFELLERRLALGRRLPMAFRRIDFLIPICWQCTDLEPARSLYAARTRLETAGPGAFGVSLAMGFPAADFAECGPVAWAYGDTPEAADEAAGELASLVDRAEPHFKGELLEPVDAVRRAMALASSGAGPVVIADTQDNPGAGGESDTTGLLRALIDCGAEQAAIGLMVDPDAAHAAHAAGVGAALHIGLGGRSGVPGDAPLVAEYRVEALSDGVFDTFGPYYKGAHMRLGPSACLRLGGVRIVVASHKAQLADRAMFQFVGIEPSEQRILVVKSTLHFRADFAPLAREILFCTAPGPMAMLPTHWRWTSLPPAIRLCPGGPTFAECQFPS
jgi:microcystin degradation protein MlrC